MDADALIVSSLVEFYSVTEIKDLWKQALDALMSRQVLNIHINQRSRDGSSSGGILLNTPAEQRAFIAACRAALIKLGETLQDGSDSASATTHVRFDLSPVAS